MRDLYIGQYFVTVHNGDSLIWSKAFKASRPLKAIEAAMNDMPTRIAINVTGDMNPGWTIGVRQFNDYVLGQ